MSSALRSLVLSCCATLAFAPLTLKSNFGAGMELPLDNQGAGDSVSPPLRWSWTGDKPKSLKTYVVIAESQKGKAADTQSADRTTNWLLYDIPDSVDELREELSGDGASSVGRLGMKEGSEQAPVIVDPMGGFGGYKDPEIEAMEDMVHNAMDASYEDANRAKEGKNSFGDDGYYHGPREGTEITFRLYALNDRLDHLPRSASKEEVLKAMKGHIIDRVSLTGYAR
jgi:hypothetical protein